MKAFRRDRDGTLSARFSAQERAVLLSLAGQVAGLLSDRHTAGGDPALSRLLPDAYRGDPDAAAEFRRFTEDSLADRKIQNAMVVADSLEAATSSAVPVDVTLDASMVQSWLRCLTDIRLTVAARLGIDADGDEGGDDDESLMLRDVYDWLGFVQGSLIEALES
ncbi:hypothetical protein GCM10027052_11810 [Parafrigoribacterium mesophilum]|uniref:DUF2017 domain-containing protein n=1 Tax=Parafrigoribacterium mesophilum TaxID=433646 RepID=UPI0031FD5623